MKFGLDLFKIGYVPNVDLKFVEDEIDQLRTVWSLKQRWDQDWQDKKETLFREIKPEDLEDLVETYHDQIKYWSKPVRMWVVVKNLMQEFEQIRNSLELIECL